jgi:hypothetical protein
VSSKVKKVRVNRPVECIVQYRDTVWVGTDGSIFVYNAKVCLISRALSPDSPTHRLTDSPTDWRHGTHRVLSVYEYGRHIMV